ncbi:Detected protein of unknown function [Hibiscus syriacus]|uniref:Pectinesterase inhibitor domain-containing protein n=1 Tax=Hibiscus syriacus TaxID=106335 RepID=A0A6A2WRL5_HIBSY|nr:Detected protein of unknown function [Hibiscus syriacus]
MECFKYTNEVFFFITVTQIFLLVLLLSASKSTVEADGDKTIITKLCDETLEPEVCLNCVLSDTSRETSNVSDMTHSILFCMYSQTTYAHATADHLFQTTAAVVLKEVFRVCKDVMFSASNTLWDGLTKMEASDYKKAHVSVRLAHADLFQCDFAFMKHGKVLIPSELLNYMVEAKRLFDVAQIMFLLLD